MVFNMMKMKEHSKYMAQSTWWILWMMFELEYKQQNLFYIWRTITHACRLAHLGYCLEFYLGKGLNHALMFGFIVKNKKGWICTISSPNPIEILNCFNGSKKKKPCAYSKSSLTINFLCTNWTYRTVHNWKNWYIIESI